MASRAIKTSELLNIMQRGSRGALIAAALSFIEGFPPDPKYVTQVLPSMGFARQPHQRGCIDRLLWIAVNCQYECIKADSHMKPVLIRLVEAQFASSADSAQSAFILMDLRGYLSTGEARIFIDHLIQQPYTADRALLKKIVFWILYIQNQPSVETAGTVEAIKSGLIQVVQQRADDHHILFEGAVIAIMLPLSFWILSGTNDPVASEAFWRGLRDLFKIRNSQTLSVLSDALEILEPLLQKVSPDLLRSAINTAELDADRLTRSLFVLFRGFGQIARVPKSGIASILGV